MIAAGKLRDRITISLAGRGRDDFGDTIEGVSNAVLPIITWAEVRQQSAAEKQRNGITTTDNTYAIRLRYRDGIDATATIAYRDRTLSIIGVVEGGHREWLEITAAEVK